MTEQLPKRQKIRKAMIFLSAILFPITIFYFSPYLIFIAAGNHVIGGSAILFISMLLFSCFFGRLFCGYVCPGAGFGEMAGCVNPKAPKLGKRRYIRYVIWVIWLAAVLGLYIKCWPIEKVDPLFATNYGISVSTIEEYMPYYLVVAILFGMPLVLGKRAVCHYICWMAPFMDIGMWIRRKLHLPGVHIEMEAEKCISCKKCTKACPMGLDVAEMVKAGELLESECAMCGACIDTCPKEVLSYKIKAKKNKK